MSDDNGPPLIRPVPRRPFTLNRQSSTPPDHEPPTSQISSSSGGSRSSTSIGATPATTTSSLGLNHHQQLGLGGAFAAWNKSMGGVSGNVSGRASPAISRPASHINMNSSTLYGIYASMANTTNSAQPDPVQDTPWGMGALTPARRPDGDDGSPNFELMRERFDGGRRHSICRRSSHKGGDEVLMLHPAMSSVQIALRTALLFALGVGYGLLVTRLNDHANQGHNTLSGDFDSMHLGAWGAAGVMFGSLLPWFDGVWEARFGPAEEQEDTWSDMAVAVIDTKDASDRVVVDASLDWVLVMRAIGAFVGIAFAIRRLAWSSTLQISAALALASPLLWWLIDRSKAGLVLSATVGLFGSVLLLGINPDMMPTLAAVPTNTTMTTMSAMGSSQAATRDNVGLMRQDGKMMEKGVWLVGVLFCSSLCFGNIGRRLFLGRAAAGPGRWSGVR